MCSIELIIHLFQAFFLLFLSVFLFFLWRTARKTGGGAYTILLIGNGFRGQIKYIFDWRADSVLQGAEEKNKRFPLLDGLLMF
jgi:hypothetical protein